jgi:hypothetical protein
VDLRTAAVTPDGGTLAFATSTPLLPSDTDSNVDVYRYDAAKDALQEVSIGTGERGNGAFDVRFGTDGSVRSLGQDGMRYLSADGRRVFFVTDESLLPEDVNKTADVYEWADGVLGLVTSGTGDGTVVYSGASADGRSVFFTTDETLVSADRNDGDEDLYVARLGGGFPSQPQLPSECEGDACQGPAAGQFERPQPGSLTYVAPPVRSFRIRPLDKRFRRGLVATGQATIVVGVPVAGRVSLVGYTRIRGRFTAVVRDAVIAPGATIVHLHFRLSAAARRILDRRGLLRLTLVVRHSRLRAALTVRLSLRRGA